MTATPKLYLGDCLEVMPDIEIAKQRIGKQLHVLKNLTTH